MFIFDGYHGTFRDLPSKDIKSFGGIHVGSMWAAAQRLFDLRAHERVSSIIDRHSGGTGSGRLIPVRVRLKNPYGSVDDPVLEDELFEILTWPNQIKQDYRPVGVTGVDETRRHPEGLVSLLRGINILKQEGYDGIIYENLVEDEGSLSVLAFYRDSIEQIGDPIYPPPRFYEGHPEGFHRDLI